MKMRWNILAVVLSVSLVLTAVAVAQTRLAVTSPTVGPDPLDSPPPSFSRSPPREVPQPGGAGPGVHPGLPLRPRSAAAAPEASGNPLWGIPLKDLAAT